MGHSLILSVVAHPDDLEIHCGGTLAKKVTEGTKVVSVICTSGERGNTYNNISSLFELGLLREQEQKKAANSLGISDLIYFRYPDGAIPNDRAFRMEIACLIRYYKPEIIITHDPWRYMQLHPDHRTVGYSVIDAIGMAREYNFLPAIDAINLTPFAPSELWLFRTDFPNYYEDISGFINKKIGALENYVSQLQPWDEWKSRVMNRAEEFGKCINAQYAEAFRKFDF